MTVPIKHSISTQQYGSQLPAPQPELWVGIEPTVNRVGDTFFDQLDASVLEHLRALTRSATVLAVSVATRKLAPAAIWGVLNAGAADVLLWPVLPLHADDIACRLQRWQTLWELVDSGPVRRAAGSA